MLQLCGNVKKTIEVCGFCKCTSQQFHGNFRHGSCVRRSVACFDPVVAEPPQTAAVAGEVKGAALMWMVKEILFPTDLSEFSRTALPFACTLARQLKARLNVLHVMPPLHEEEPGATPRFLRRRQGRLERFVTPEPGIEIERTTTGSAQAIVQTAADFTCRPDCVGHARQNWPGALVVGAHRTSRAMPLARCSASVPRLRKQRQPAAFHSKRYLPG